MESIVRAHQHVSINSSTSGAYNVVCKKCISSPKFAHFDDFLNHSHAEHGPTVRRSALSIITENTLISAGGSISHLSTGSCLSTTLTGSSHSNDLSTTNTDNEFDLRTLKRQCMLDVIELLNKCFCIWHRPTRASVPRSERLHAYQLVLMRLREHLPFATFRDARSIVRQIIRGYLRKQRLSEGDVITHSARLNVDQHDDDADNWQLERQLDAIKSRIIMDRLAFLRGCDDNDVEELVADKLCSFCNIGFHNTETLWTHMVSAHLPAHKQDRSGCSAADTMATESTLTLSRKRSRSHISRSTFENSTDVTQQSYSGSEPSSLRRSRRRRRGIWRNGQRVRSKNKVVGLKRIRQRRRTRSKSGADDVSVASQQSNLYLADYSDKFLEEFIDLYRQQECLWQRDSRTYRNRRLRAAAYDVLLKKYCQARQVSSVSLNKIKSLIRRMRNYYVRLQQPNANPYRSHIWQRMSFIDQCRTPPARNRHSSKSNDIRHTDYDCTVCLRRFKRAKSFASHMLKTHPPTECPPCSETFNNADELVRHLLFIHRKDTDCPLCQDGENEWKSSAHLNKHFFEHRCPNCAEMFRDIINYRRHRSKCRNINRFRCEHCSSKFTSTMDFRRHAKASHQDERPFKCNDCETTFKYLAPLAKHRRLHKRMKRRYSA
ncbi:PREDICTED: zinc finger protein 354B-like [Rhagoletis zephyria]|uniref:zinc finger protein 354B-like n=1 Tax=Rhagoletis zephyria TaxID=28612 RepID=UPI0008117F3F|nr:PREDICTED: zinc finger protein 354B-like [Rhagoletis zephyria]